MVQQVVLQSGEKKKQSGIQQLPVTSYQVNGKK